jgi:hypothetical protein
MRAGRHVISAASNSTELPDMLLNTVDPLQSAASPL